MLLLFENALSTFTTDPVLAATVCLSHDQAQKALLEGNFDVAVVEVSTWRSLFGSKQLLGIQLETSKCLRCTGTLD